VSQSISLSRQCRTTRTASKPSRSRAARCVAHSIPRAVGSALTLVSSDLGWRQDASRRRPLRRADDRCDRARRRDRPGSLMRPFKLWSASRLLTFMPSTDRKRSLRRSCTRLSSRIWRRQSRRTTPSRRGCHRRCSPRTRLRSSSGLALWARTAASSTSTSVPVAPRSAAHSAVRKRRAVVASRAATRGSSTCGARRAPSITATRCRSRRASTLARDAGTRRRRVDTVMPSPLATSSCCK
jgi:hypothetical protein